MKKTLKNVFAYVMVAVISIVASFATYSYLNNRHYSGPDADIYNSFSGQQPNQAKLHLANFTAEGYPDFTQAAENAVNGVVHIKSTVRVQGGNNQRMMDPFEYFFGFGNRNTTPSQPRESVGFGSGVIISKDGYVITNNHVIDKANAIEVTLNDNSQYTAKLIGTDPDTDIALLKIEGDNFPFVPFGDSDALRVGEWVLAVGNPFNLNSTVTAGIVSAKNRGGIGSGGIQSFIQVDAAINRGNSGGALINTKGELVGINTAIYSQTGDFAGYGFAVPIAIAGKVVSDIKEYGTVQRARLGVEIMDISRAKQAYPEKTKDVTINEGVYVGGFAERSPAKEAGLEEGDVITSVGGVKVRNSSELQEQISRYRPGDKLKLQVKRGNSDKTFDITLKNSEGNTSIIKKSDAVASIGAAFKELSDEKKKQHGVSYGVEVTGVDNNGKFKAEGITKGFIIMKINNQPVSNADDVEEMIQAAAASQDKVLFIAGFYPNGRTKYYAIELGD